MHRNWSFPLVWLIAAGLATPCLVAQTIPDRTSEQIRASYEAHRADFDYLLGDWEFTADHSEFGAGRGFWSAIRLAEGQVLDEYRLVGDDDETFYVTTTLRAYNAVLDRWELIGMDGGFGLHDTGIGHRVGDEIHIEQTFGAMTPEPSLWRIRYYDIRPDGFSWSADRSTDGGATWVAGYLRIQARRIGPPRSMGPLATGRKAAGTGP